jgi:hypothetical protein
LPLSTKRSKLKKVMKKPSLYDEASLKSLLIHQQEHAWDLEHSIQWKRGIDLDKPFVPLDENAIVFPGAGNEERLAISQAMGLLIAMSICEMEDCLLRLRKEGWTDIYSRFPVSPELDELADQFYDEEEKHSAAFRRFIVIFCEKTGVEPEDLKKLLPVIEKTRTESLLKKSILKGGGYAFWWIVVTVEQQFLHMHHALKSGRDRIDPLYFELHEKHFEEEMRHAPFPYLVLDMLFDQTPSLRERLNRRADLVLAQLTQVSWSVHSLSRLKIAEKIKHKHPFFEALAALYPKLKNEPFSRTLWSLTTSAPYVSSLINPHSHQRILRFADKKGALTLPFPSFQPKKIVNY